MNKNLSTFPLHLPSKSHIKTKLIHPMTHSSICTRSIAAVVALSFTALAANPDTELPGGVAKHFHRGQRKVENYDRQQRKQLSRYDQWLNELKQAL